MLEFKTFLANVLVDLGLVKGWHRKKKEIVTIELVWWWE